MKYHVLFAKDRKSGKWLVEFGAYDFQDVKDERDDIRDKMKLLGPEHEYSSLMIVSLKGDAQIHIDTKLKALNSYV